MTVKLSFIEQTPGYFMVTGTLTFASINKQTLANFFKLSQNHSQTISIDFSGVEAVDSAGLALMVEWIRWSQIQAVKLSFKNIPEQLLALAKLSGLDQIQYFVGISTESTDTTP